LFVIDVSTPSQPKIVGRAAPGSLKNPRKIAFQFMHAFVTDDDGVKVFDLTVPLTPRLIATVPLKDAQGLYAARTYLYVANGAEGLAIVDIKNPAKPTLFLMWNAYGALTDTRAVQIGAVNASMFALVADGKNGLRVVQMISPENVPGYQGFSPPPNPKLIATYPTRGPAVAVGRGLDRDRVVDESGHQTVVFGRRGSRPFNAAEFNAFIHNSDGALYRVNDPIWREGRLETLDGKPLLPTSKFVPTPEPAVVTPSTNRVVRRPAE
jgi:hypothetical protein